MKPTAVIKLAHNLKKHFRTDNPFTIAQKLGIIVIERSVNISGFTAQIIKFDDYPAIISINSAYTDFSKKILCAHELGHALMHENCVNHFAVTNSNLPGDVERDANLFAIALLTDNDINRQLTIPLKDMNNYLLKSIIDYNLKLNN